MEPFIIFYILMALVIGIIFSIMSLPSEDYSNKSDSIKSDEVDQPKTQSNNSSDKTVIKKIEQKKPPTYSNSNFHFNEKDELGREMYIFRNVKGRFAVYKKFTLSGSIHIVKVFSKYSQAESFIYKGIHNNKNMTMSSKSKKIKRITKLERKSSNNKVESTFSVPLNSKIKIKFIEETHEYFVNGEKVISVTELIDKYSRELNIYNDYANVPQHVLRKAAIKGEAMHKEIELYEKSGAESHSIEFYNYKKLKKKLKFKVHHNEIMVAIKNSSGKFVAAGRLDMLISIGNQLGIIDIKRTSKFYEDKVTAQINLYKLGLMHTYGIDAEKMMCIRLREDISEYYSINNDTNKIFRVLDSIS